MRCLLLSKARRQKKWRKKLFERNVVEHAGLFVSALPVVAAAGERRAQSIKTCEEWLRLVNKKLKQNAIALRYIMSKAKVFLGYVLVQSETMITIKSILQYPYFIFQLIKCSPGVLEIVFVFVLLFKTTLKSECTILSTWCS